MLSQKLGHMHAIACATWRHQSEAASHRLFTGLSKAHCCADVRMMLAVLKQAMSVAHGPVQLGMRTRAASDHSALIILAALLPLETMHNHVVAAAAAGRM